MRSILVCLFLGCLPLAAALPALIPLPREVAEGEGRLVLTDEIGVATADDADAARLLAVLAEAGLKPRLNAVGAGIELRRGEVKNPHGFGGAYRLEVEGGKVVVTAADRAGMIHAAETLHQLLRKNGDKVDLPRVTIADWPAFPVRGFMLDTGRNYQSPELLKEQIEVMARYKLNVFHFHFTDNPGWRLESKVHPAVTSSMTRQPGKYYTHREFRELVAFCRERGITLIPEMDMPGHSESLRKSLGITSMNSPESRKILKELLSELASLASPVEMPSIHLGTDEIREKGEHVDSSWLPEMSAHVRSLGREVIGWRKGLEDPADKKRITQLWARANPLPENPFLDCRSTYINHMDPFEVVSTFLFQQSCRRPHGDARALGGILCSWPDIRIESERDQLRQNPVYPGMVTYAESMWRGVEKDDREQFWANLPAPGTPEWARFVEFEARLLDHKERYFRGKEFPYFKQTDLRWRIIGPFPHGGDVAKEFPVESELRDSYEIDGKNYRWLDRGFGAATVYLKHFFGFGAPVKEAEGTCYALTHVWSPKHQEMPAWIGFHGSSRSDRRGAFTFRQGEWHDKKPWIRVNGSLVAPPVWENAAPRVKDNETPFTNEDFFFREPSKIRLKKGWNEVLLKIPHRRSDWKWMFTFIPVGDTAGLRYSSELNPESMIRTLTSVLLGSAAVLAESFESPAAGPFTVLESSVGRWSAEEGHARVHAGLGKSGKQCLRLAGEGERQVLLALPAAAEKGAVLVMQAERWTKRGPFDFRIEAKGKDGWSEVLNGSATVKVGGFLTELRAELPAGTREVRFRLTAPADAGLLLDDVMILRPGPARATTVETAQPVCPAFIREDFNPVLGFRVAVEGSEGEVMLEGIELGFGGTTRMEDIASFRIHAGSADPAAEPGPVIGEGTKAAEKISLSLDHPLPAGEHWFWVSPILKESASIDGRIDASVFRVKAGGKMLEPAVASPEGAQRIGYAVRVPGDDGSKSYRIPGLVRSKAGTLIAVYDIRYGHAGDLPANIDVGVSRSTDGGQSWEPMQVAMDMGNDPKHGFDGVGDPSILVDPSNGRIWIAALWSHGNRAWNGSGPGMTPEETGQLVLACSDDDGKTWSKPVNITTQVKDPAQRLFFNGPGMGIALKDGTLVFPAQYRAADGKPWSTLIFSKDHGKTWQPGTGMKIDTTEAQVAELADGSIMINARDNRGGSRTVAVTKDLGKTWQLHPSDRKALREPVCMASLLEWKGALWFSNPDATDGRHSMTVKRSQDQGLTWPVGDFRLYDSRGCFGYSCLAPVDDSHLGVIYEGKSTMYFLRFPVGEWE